MKSRSLITSCSNKFFPSVINLLTSIKVNYPNHPHIYVYDLGLFTTFRKELESIEGVTVVDIPPFCPHWRNCYTWKTYILAHPFTELNFYIDAGCQILRPLNEVFDIIEKDSLLLLDTGCSFENLIPKEYREIFDLGDKFNSETTFSAGIIGFSNEPQIMKIFKHAYAAGISGLTLGFSADNLWRNKGKDKNIFIRSSSFFRHDQTLINLFYKKYFPEQKLIRSHDDYSYTSKNKTPNQLIWHLRLGYSNLEYTKINQLHKDKNILYQFNRLIIKLMLALKNTNALIKKIWKNI